MNPLCAHSVKKKAVTLSFVLVFGQLLRLLCVIVTAVSKYRVYILRMEWVSYTIVQGVVDASLRLGSRTVDPATRNVNETRVG